jgi:hypothetical protein
MKHLFLPLVTSMFLFMAALERPAQSQDHPIAHKKGDVLLDGKIRVADLGPTEGKPYSVVLENLHPGNLVQKFIVRWYDKRGRLVRKGLIQWRTLQIEKGKSLRLTAPAPFVVSAAVEFR